MLQFVDGQFAIGVGQLLGCGAPAAISEGVEPLGKKKICIPESCHSTIPPVS